VLSYLKVPQPRHIKYLDNIFIEKILLHIEQWSLNKSKVIYIITLAALAFAALGITRLKSEGFYSG